MALGKPDFSAPDGVTTSLAPFQPFFGTSAAAPDAAAVGALMLQADGRLTNKQVTYLLKASAIPFGNTGQSGAGLIPADTAVDGAITAATTPIWTGQAGSTSWSNAGNWSDNQVPDEFDDVTIGNGIGALSGAYSVVYGLTSSAVASLRIDGASAFSAAAAPTLTIAAGARLSAISFAIGAGAFNLAGSLEIAGGVDSMGAISFDGTATTQALLTLDRLAQPFAAGQFDATLADFGNGDALDLKNLIDADATYADGQLTVTGVDPFTNQTKVEQFTLTNAGAAVYFAHDDGSNGTLIDDIPVCFASGTAIRAKRQGRLCNVAVEDLRIDDLVFTATGTTCPVRWLGHRVIDCHRHAYPTSVQPVRILAHAFGASLPARDLYLSPGHPVLVGADADGKGGHLVPIMCLVNGTTIERVRVDSVTYWHVELDEHNILLAEGLAAESYIDLGSRQWFAGAHGALYDPDMALLGMPGRCRPVAIDGPVVEAERRRLDMVFTTRLAGASAWPSEADALFAD